MPDPVASPDSLSGSSTPRWELYKLLGSPSGCGSWRWPAAKS
jgi:hypothetical protein